MGILYQPQSWSRIIDFGNGENIDNIVFYNERTKGDLAVYTIDASGRSLQMVASNVLEEGKWLHLAFTLDASGKTVIYLRMGTA